MNTNFKYNPLIEVLQGDLGFTGKDKDGKRGNTTNEAIIRAADEGRLSVKEALVIIAKPEVTNTTLVTGISKLDGVHPKLVEVILEAFNRSKVKFSVTEGLRNAARQKHLVSIGASKTTDSRHLTGHAVDLWPQDDAGKNLPSDAAFPKGSASAKAADAALWAGLREISKVVLQVAKEKGINVEWGGSWGWDAPHFQLNRVAYPK